MSYTTSATSTGFWRNPDIKLYRFAVIGFPTIAILVLLFFIYIYWVIGALVTLPYHLTDYASIYFLVYIVVVPVNIVVPCQRVDVLYVLGFFFNLVSFIVMSWLWFLIFYTRYNCYTGVLPTSCRDAQLFELILLGTVTLFWFFQLVIFFGYCILLRAISHKRSYTQVNI